MLYLEEKTKVKFDKGFIFHEIRKKFDMTEETCLICMESIDDSLHWSLECNHKFHTECIIQWFRRGNDTCPSCRDQGNIDALDHQDSFARASYLRKEASKKRCPPELKKLIEKVRLSESKTRESRKKLMEFRKTHREIFSEWSKMRSTYYLQRRNEIRQSRILGTFSHPDYPVQIQRRRNLY